MASRSAPGRPHRPYVVAALVLGTAISALGSSAARASVVHSEATLKAIADIDRYCATCWRNARLPADAWTDCTQDVFRRLLERVPSARWDQVLRAEGEERREFFRAIDAVKKKTQRARRHVHALDGVADAREQQARSLHERREAVRQASDRVLSERQQRIIRMSFEGWSVAEMAEELALAPERVSDEKYKAIRKLRAELEEENS